ncbi:hypothetical protein EYF80_014897 [Liparis tanakae]|uniref:Uncharacterized protein n=1 Tax=Liparis tanakae TaxID=230148 RepID=A0A4Z2IA19_9TELE|nr:hypothetical protein EYF80_014897 [Liparis tanakae]
MLRPPPAPLARSPRPLWEDGLLLLLHTHSPKSSLRPPPSLLPSWESSRPARQVRASSMESAKDLTWRGKARLAGWWRVRSAQAKLAELEAEAHEGSRGPAAGALLVLLSV